MHTGGNWGPWRGGHLPKATEKVAQSWGWSCLQVCTRSLSACRMCGTGHPSPIPNRSQRPGQGSSTRGHTACWWQRWTRTQCPDSGSGGFSAPPHASLLGAVSASGRLHLLCLSVQWEQAVHLGGASSVRWNSVHPCRPGAPLTRPSLQGQRRHAAPGPPRRCPPGAPGLCP